MGLSINDKVSNTPCSARLGKFRELRDQTANPCTPQAPSGAGRPGNGTTRGDQSPRSDALTHVIGWAATVLYPGCATTIMEPLEERRRAVIAVRSQTDAADAVSFLLGSRVTP